MRQERVDVQRLEPVPRQHALELARGRINASASAAWEIVLGTIRVGAIGSAEAEIPWFVNFELDDERAWPAVKAGIEGMYRAATDGLEAPANRVVTRR